MTTYEQALINKLLKHASEMRKDGVALYCPDLLEVAAQTIERLSKAEPERRPAA